MTSGESEKILVGRFGSPIGLKGEIKVHSFTEPKSQILTYQPWWLKIRDQWQSGELVTGKEHSTALKVLLKNYTDRTSVEKLVGIEIYIERQQLPALEAGDYYWQDFIGCKVVNVQGQDLGLVTGLMSTGSNDVLIIKGERERLIPYLPDKVIMQIDLPKQTITVDWDADF